jgi:hypothetical protein
MDMNPQPAWTETLIVQEQIAAIHKMNSVFDGFQAGLAKGNPKIASFKDGVFFLNSR